jgi:hypothetical protein
MASREQRRIRVRVRHPIPRSVRHRLASRQAKRRASHPRTSRAALLPQQPPKRTTWDTIVGTALGWGAAAATIVHHVIQMARGN